MTGSGKAERRQLTVLFCDMVGSTRIAAELGAEEWRELLQAYQESVSAVIEGHEGSVAQYLGDGVVAYFGHPHAHEDDAERAIHAGLAIVEEIKAHAPALLQRYGQVLAVRVGIHTGAVVVGEVGSGRQQKTLAVGAPAALAGHIQAEAGQGEVMVSAATRRLARGIFVTEELGPRVLEGSTDPVRLYRVVRPTGASTRLEVQTPEGLTPFIARSEEFELLTESWSRARSGNGQVVLLGGEAGMGKSRLVKVFRDHAQGQTHQWLELRGSRFHSHTAFYPLAKPIEQLLRIDRRQPPEAQRLHIAEQLRAAGLNAEDAMPIFANLLGVPLDEHESPFAVSVDARLDLTLDMLTRYLMKLSETQPMVVVLEDLHWVDSPTLDLVSRLLDRVTDAPLLVIGTYRLVFQPPWALGPSARRVTLNPLTRAQTDAMILAITGGVTFPDAVRNQVIARTDGIPLFVEELTQTVLESGALERKEDHYEETGPIPDFSVPATLQDSLMARLDKLGAAKGVAQMAAVLGRDCSAALLARLVDNPDSLEMDLDSLVAAGVLQRTDEPDSATYTFKHALIQETAYESLLKSTRRTWHAQVAKMVEQHFPALAVAEPERLARHCRNGGLTDRAVTYYQSAADQALQRSATSEAMRHLTRGIELLRTLPDTAQRSKRELILQLELGMTLVAAEGWGSSEAQTAYRRARELCDDIGELPQVFRVMRGLITFYTARAELAPAREVADRLTKLAEQSGESHLRLLSNQQMGIIHYFEGNPGPALEYFERAVALYEPSEHRELTRLHGEDLGVLARIWMAWPQWLLGFPDQAVRTSQEALDLGREVGHPFSLAYAFVWTAILHVMRREPQRARESAQQAAEISEQQGFAFLLAESQLVIAWAKLHEPLSKSEMTEAAAGFQECVTRVGGRGIMANAPMMIGYLSEARLRAGQLDQATASVDAGLGLSQATGQKQWDAELHRLKGEYLLRGEGDEREVEALFRRGLEIARSQDALSLELRVALSLARLWTARGKIERARALVEPIHAQFNEGFGCPDLVEAAQLLRAPT